MCVFSGCLNHQLVHFCGLLIKSFTQHLCTWDCDACSLTWWRPCRQVLFLACKSGTNFNKKPTSLWLQFYSYLKESNRELIRHNVDHWSLANFHPFLSQIWFFFLVFLVIFIWESFAFRLLARQRRHIKPILWALGTFDKHFLQLYKIL